MIWGNYFFFTVGKCLEEKAQLPKLYPQGNRHLREDSLVITGERGA